MGLGLSAFRQDFNMYEYSLGRNARMSGASLDHNPYPKDNWKYKEWQAGYLDHKHRMEYQIPVTLRQKIKF